jgi:tetratricopeptide (TPR) repeat protein
MRTSSRSPWRAGRGAEGAVLPGRTVELGDHGLQDRDREALRYAQLATDLLTDHSVAHARALNGVGWYHARLGEYPAAISVLERAPAALQQLDDLDGQGITWDSLGYVHHQRGQYDQAAECYRHAVELLSGLGDRPFQASALISLGDAYHAVGDRSSARAAWQRGLEILDDLNHPDAQQVRDRLDP